MIDERTREIYGTGQVVSPRSLAEREAEDPYRGAPSVPYDVTPRAQPKPQDIYREVNPMFSTAYDEMNRLNNRSAESQARQNAMYQEVPSTAGYKALINRLGPRPYSTSGGIEDREVPIQEQIRRAKMGFDVDHGSKQEKLAAQMGLQSAINGIYARANAQTNEYNRAGQDAYRLALADRMGQSEAFLNQEQGQRSTVEQLLRNAGYEQQNMLNYNTEQRRLDQAAVNDAHKNYWENVAGTSGLMERYGQNWGDMLTGSLVGVQPDFLTDGGTYGEEAAARDSARNSAARLSPGKSLEEYLTAATATFSPELRDQFDKNPAAKTQFQRGIKRLTADGRKPEPGELHQLAAAAALTGGRMLYNPKTGQMEQVDEPLTANQDMYNRNFVVKTGQALGNAGKWFHDSATAVGSLVLPGVTPTHTPRYPAFNDVLQTPSGQQYYDFGGDLTEEQLQMLGFSNPL